MSKQPNDVVAGSELLDADECEKLRRLAVEAPQQLPTPLLMMGVATGLCLKAGLRPSVFFGLPAKLSDIDQTARAIHQAIRDIQYLIKQNPRFRDALESWEARVNSWIAVQLRARRSKA